LALEFPASSGRTSKLWLITRIASSFKALIS
jgi:hypothetical protein